MKLPITSELIRKRWVREGLIKAASISYFAPMTGRNDDSVIMMDTNENASDGHTMIFDYDGYLTNRPVKGAETAFGKGEEKKKFSSKLTVEMFRYTADNGTEFDAVEIGDLAVSQHSDSRNKLADLFIRAKDQWKFDELQSVGKTPSHTWVFDGTSGFGVDELTEIETLIKTGEGFTTGDKRRPMKPFRTDDGRAMWLFIVDPVVAGLIKQNDDWKNIVSQGDVRGNKNKLFTGVLGRFGQLIVMEAPRFFGQSDDIITDIANTDLNIAGLRQFDAGGDWTGQSSFGGTTRHSRCLILGANAAQFGLGKSPDYKFQPSPDFGIKSESELRTWYKIQKTVLTEENGDYDDAPMAGIDWGVIAADIKVVA